MPPLAISLALSSAFIHASWNAALKGVQGRVADRLTDSFLVAVGGILAGGALMAFLGAPNEATWPFLTRSVIIHLIYWFTLFKAYDAGDMSHVYTISRGLAPLLVTFGAIGVAHEVPPPLKMAGIVGVSLGVALVGASRRATPAATLWAIALGIAIAGYSLNDALGARVSHNAALYVGWTTGLMSVPMALFPLLRRGPSRMLKDARIAPIRGIAIGIVSFAGYGLVLWAQTMAPIAQVTALRETSVVFGAAIALVTLKERLGLRRAVGSLIVATGAGLIALA